jgi:predicted SAM-dependent methyltransferase
MTSARPRFSLRRPLGSYVKVQRLVGASIRSRRFQLSNAGRHDYLNIGCGPNVREGFLNIDYAWRPGVVCWDITQGLPLESGSIRGAFTEHCLEHLPLPLGYALLVELRRVLAPGSVARIVVPDAELYLHGYIEKSAKLPYAENDRFLGLYTPLMSVNRIFYVQRDEAFGHNFMYDYETLALLLKRAGFSATHKRAFGEGADPRLLIDTESRRVESLYLEAIA